MNVQRGRGVALIVQNSIREILILQECRSKPHIGKLAGMFSIPMETCWPGESVRSAVVRLVKEELPGVDIPVSDAITYIGSYRVVPRVWARLFFIKAKTDALPEGESEEVDNHQWVAIDKALDLWLRQGAYEMISDFAENIRGALRMHCRAPGKKK